MQQLTQAQIYEYRTYGSKAQKAANDAKGLLAAIKSGDAGKIGCASGAALTSAGTVVALVPCGKCQVVGLGMMGIGALTSAIAC